MIDTFITPTSQKQTYNVLNLVNSVFDSILTMYTNSVALLASLASQYYKEKIGFSIGIAIVFIKSY